MRSLVWPTVLPSVVRLDAQVECAGIVRLALGSLLLLALGSAVADRAGAQGYNFPLTDVLAATVVGTPPDYRADLPDISLRERELVVFPDRQIPELFWYTDRLRFGLLAQPEKAPLAFVIAGTGAGHDAQKARLLARMFDKIGFHVITLPSSTFENFIVTASTTSVPGLITEDAADLHRVMQLAYDQVKDEIEVTSFHLTGYSLGAAQAAFVAKLDETEQAFGFERVLMINPPVSLYNSALILDRMLDENTPQGVGMFFNRMLAVFAEVFVQEEDTVSLNGDFLYTVYRRRRPSDESLQAAIGISFRLASANMAFTSDVMTKAGYIAPKVPPLTPTTSLSEFAAVAMRSTFKNYIDDLFYPYFKTRQPGVTLDDLIEITSLRSIEQYLRTSEKIGLMHNEDDIILAAGELEYLRQIFDDRAEIYPTGGHCGNMDYPDNVAHMMDFFRN
jgi:predicted alpha/beta-fold hydrolase